VHVDRFVPEDKASPTHWNEASAGQLVWIRKNVKKLSGVCGSDDLADYANNVVNSSVLGLGQLFVLGSWMGGLGRAQH
jgi:hypothetical protein